MRTLSTPTSILTLAFAASVSGQPAQEPKPDQDRAPASDNAQSPPDEQVVQEMLRRTTKGLPAAIIRESLVDCARTTLSMKICANYRWTEQDIRLNRAYVAAAGVAVQYETSLSEARKAWEAYRDAQCLLEGEIGAGGGTLEGLYVLECKMALTKQQADRLEQAMRE